MKKLILSLLFAVSPAMAEGDVTCDTKARIETIQALSTTQAQQIFQLAGASGQSSGTWVTNRKFACITNLDTTAANHVWISTFQVTATVSGVLDTSKSYPIPGGNVADAERCFPWGANIPIWLHRVIGTSKFAAWACE